MCFDSLWATGALNSIIIFIDIDSDLFTCQKNCATHDFLRFQVRNPTWPDEYNGAYFFADFSRGTLSYGKHHWITDAFQPFEFAEISSILSITQDSSGDIWMTACVLT